MSRDDEFYDDLETRDPEQRAREQWAQLQTQLGHARETSARYREVLADIAPEDIRSRADLAKIATTRKSDMAALQKANRPLGGMNAVPLSQLRHIFASPGGIYEPDGHDKDYWRFGRALWAAGLRPGMIVHNTYSYHLTPAAMLVESGAHAVGCPVFPGGTGNTEQQLQAIEDIRPDAYAGTPSFLRILLEKARETGKDVSSIKRGMVGGEALPPSLRAGLKEMGVEVQQGYGTADLGSIAYESKALEGMIIDEGVLVEIVEPLGTEPVAEGEIGEVVVTTFNPVYPLIRFATGDLSAVLPGASPCGRTNMRIRGWMGRADQSTKVKGMFVHPSLVMQVAGRHPEIRKARLVVTSQDNVDVMTLKVAAEGAGEGFAAAVAETIRDVMKLRGEVELTEAGNLPDDGLMIEDARTYE